MAIKENWFRSNLFRNPTHFIQDRNDYSFMSIQGVLIFGLEYTVVVWYGGHPTHKDPIMGSNNRVYSGSTSISDKIQILCPPSKKRLLRINCNFFTESLNSRFISTLIYDCSQKCIATYYAGVYFKT